MTKVVRPDEWAALQDHESRIRAIERAPAQGVAAAAIEFDTPGSGLWILPSGAVAVIAVLLGGGGGGGGGAKSGSATLVGGAGTGGGGGAVSITTWSAAELVAMYPSGVPWTVGIGGGGGTAGGATGGDGANGGVSTFGLQAAGGGGGGRGGKSGSTIQNVFAGSGGGITSGAHETPGNPSQAAGTPGVGLQGGRQAGQGTWPTPVEFGGAAGAVYTNTGLTFPKAAPGFQGGSSLWGGGGGGGGGCYSQTATLQKGGKGGLTGVYVSNVNQGNGTNSDGSFVGPWAGNGGDGGDGQTAGGGNARNGGNGGGFGSFGGAGGGGGGGSGLALAGVGGAASAGRIVLFVLTTGLPG